MPQEGQLSDVSTIVGATSATSGPALPQTQEAEAEIKTGQTSLSQGDYGAALETLQNAEANAQEAQINVNITDQLRATAGVQISVASSSSISTTSTTSTAASSTDTTEPATSSFPRREFDLWIKSNPCPTVSNFRTRIIVHNERMRLGALLGWGIVIYAVVWLAWSLFGVYAWTSGVLPRVAEILVLLIVCVAAGSSLRYRSWKDILPYSIGWALVALAIDALFSAPTHNWTLFSLWTTWLGYALIALFPLFALFFRNKKAHSRAWET